MLRNICLVPSEQSLRTKQTLKGAYFPQPRYDLFRLLINVDIEAFHSTPVQAQLMLPLLPGLVECFAFHTSQCKCVSVS